MKAGIVARLVAALLLPATPVLGQHDGILVRGPTLEQRRTVSLGGGDGPTDEFFGKIIGGAVLPDGRFAVADGQAQEIRVFDRTGALLKVIGGPGDGPGEFRELAGVAAFGDGSGIVAWDAAIGRASLFDSEGNLVHAYLVQRRTLLASRLDFVGPRLNGGVVVRASFDPMVEGRQTPGTRRDSVVVGVFDRSGVERETYGFSGPERDFFEENGRWGYSVPIFGRHVVTAVTRDTLLVADTDSLVIRRFSDTRELLPVRLPSRPPPASAAEIAAERTARIRAVNLAVGANAPPAIREVFTRLSDRIRDARVLETLPALTNLFAIPTGGFWLQGVPDRDANTTRMIRLTSGGEPRGVVEIPASERVIAVSDGMILGVVTDDLGRESVCVRTIGR